MNTDNLLLLNFILIVALAFVVYRQAVVYTFRSEREIQEIHQEIRNQAESFDRRIESTEQVLWRNIDQLHETVYKIQDEQPKKSTKGLNSRIPF